MLPIPLVLLASLVSNSRNPFQSLNGVVPRQQGRGKPIESLPVYIVSCVEKCPEGDEIVDGQSNVRFQGIQAFLGDTVERGLRVLIFETSQARKDEPTEEEPSGEGS